MLRICIPVHNEATTIGVLLWRLRTVFQGFSREYDVVVHDDASTDGTAEVLEPYRSVMPLTVLRSSTHRGYAASIDALVRHVAADDEYARRDAMVLLQGDFTESPEHLPELVKRFEGGADLVAVERTISDATPADERRLRRWGRWAIKPFVRLPAITDPFTGYRLVRIAVLRDLLRAMGSRPVCSGEGWAANIDFVLNVAPFARRIENVALAPRYDVRQRPSRRRGWADVFALFHWARASRQVARPVPGARASAADAAPRERTADPSLVTTPVERAPRRSAPRPDERSPDRRPRGDRPERAERAERTERPERAEKAERPERSERAERTERAPRPPRDTAPAAERTPPAPRTPRPPRPERADRPKRGETPEPAEATAPAPAVVPAPAARLEAAPPDEGELSILDLAPDAEGGDGDESGDDGTEAASADGTAPRKRRRRRRSRKGRGQATAGGEGGTDADGDAPEAAGTDAMADIGGTSDTGEGPDDDDGSDAPSSDAGAAGPDGDAERARRRRRQRRRRRPRRAGEPESSASDDAPSPAAEPPAA